MTIIVGTGPSSVEVPQLYGNTPAQARAILEEARPELGDRSSDYNGDVAEGSIFFQNPSEGQRVEPGTAVDVTVSLGVEPVEVPEVYGLSVAEAQATLSGVGLNSTAVEVEGDEAAGTALSTDPGVGATLDPGSTVTLYYSAGPPPVTTPSPTASARRPKHNPKTRSPPRIRHSPKQRPSPRRSPNRGRRATGSGDDKPAPKPTKPSGGQQDSGSGGGNSGPGSGGGTVEAAAVEAAAGAQGSEDSGRVLAGEPAMSQQRQVSA